ncbi:DUF4026 domain-containing protein [Viscerimonas tarda]
MENSEKYDILAEGEVGIPSTMGIIPGGKDFKFTEASIRASLAENRDFKLLSFSAQEDEEAAYTAEIEYLEEEYSIDLYIVPTSQIGLEDYGFGNQIEKTDFDNAGKQSHFLETTLFFGSDPLSSFHLQLKMMNAIVPDASLAVDFQSFRLLSAHWLKMTAKSPTPPSPDYLYTLHAVYNEVDGETKYWFHTHGLLRCGVIELEIVDVTDGAQQMNDLVMMVVKKFLNDPAKEKEKFQIGYDGLGINLSWLRWEEAVKDLSETALGGKEDREGDDNIHAEPSGVLFAVEENNLVSPQIYASTLSNNPIYYISNEETRRMSALAKERFPFLLDVYEKHAPKEKKSLIKKLFGKKEENEAAWSFLVKLGLTVDNSSAETEKEHLWFEIVSLEENSIEGKLLNQPYWISSLNEGDIRKYPLELLTDWIIYSPEGHSYTTDSIYQLGYS